MRKLLFGISLSVCCLPPDYSIASYDECQLVEADAIDGWKFLKKDSRFKLAKLCNDGTPEAQSMTVLGPEKEYDELRYRELFLVHESEKSYQTGIAVESRNDSAKTGFFGSFDIINSAANSASLVKLYLNSITKLKICIRNIACFKSMISNYSFSETLFDEQYREFYKKVNESYIDSLSNIRLGVFDYDNQASSLSFVASFEKNKKELDYWYFEFEVSSAGKIERLRRISQVIRDTYRLEDNDRAGFMSQE